MPTPTEAAHSTRHEERTPRPPLFVAVLTLIAAYLRFGYWYGSGDHDELVPSVLHLLDGSLFTQDWLIQTVTSGINVRTFFLWLTALPSFVLPPWVIFFVLWIVVFFAVAYGVYGMAYELVRDRLAAAVSVFTVCVVTVRWTLGSNALVYDMLVPEGVAWALAVPAITLGLRGRWVAAGALLGVATWFHLLVGVHAAIVLGVVGLGRAVARADLGGTGVHADLATLVRFAGVFALVASPMLLPALLDQLAPDIGGTIPAYYIHARFRNPHHLLFSAFEIGHHLRFWPVVAAGVGGGMWLASRDQLHHGRALAGGGLVIAVLSTLGAVAGDLAAVSFIAKLQFFKLTVLVTLVATILATAAVVRALPETLRGLSEHLLERSRLSLSVALILVGIIGWMAMTNVSRPGALLHPARHTASPLGEVEAWALSETPRDALFAIPPSVSTFRSFARRAVVADFTGFAFTDAAMQQWFQRLMDVAPIEPPELGVGVKPVLDAAYHRQPAAAWRQLRASYGIDHVLVVRDEATLPFAVAFENEGWVVYALSNSDPR